MFPAALKQFHPRGCKWPCFWPPDQGFCLENPWNHSLTLPIALANKHWVLNAIMTRWLFKVSGITVGWGARRRGITERLLLNSPTLNKTEHIVEGFIKCDGKAAVGETSSTWVVGRMRRRVYPKKLPGRHLNEYEFADKEGHSRQRNQSMQRCEYAKTLIC